jgi:hypothetical protein
MARNQKNFGLQLYVDDNTVSWNVRGEVGGAFAAVDGHAALDATKAVWDKQTRRFHVRHVVAQDPITFRTVKGIIYTAAAYAAIATGSVVAVTVAGLATTVNYTVIAKIPERKPSVATARMLADS